MTTTTQLRVSGLLSIVAFLAVLVSDLLMLTDLDPSKRYRFWTDAPQLPQAQVTAGYYLGELAIPLLFASAWHLSLAVRPAGRWAVWTVVGTTAYALPLVAVWHVGFPFTRSILRAEIASRLATTASDESQLAFLTYALPLFRVGLVVAALGYSVVFGLALAGKTEYPRWAGVALPGIYGLIAFLLRPVAPIWADALLGAGGWNLAGAVMFTLSTAVLWNRGGWPSQDMAAKDETLERAPSNNALHLTAGDGKPDAGRR